MHIIASKAVCFGEALKPQFKEYQKNIKKNAKALSEGLIKNGFNLISGGTDNHLILVDLQNMNITGKEAERLLDDVGITCNKNSIPNDPQSPFVTSGIRLGTPAVTTRGFDTDDMEEIAALIAMTIKDYSSAQAEVKNRVEALCAKHKLYE